jgi:succinyl-CoA synthetase beta subunit
MDLHEYQAKEFLKKYNLPIPDFEIASNEAEVKAIAKKQAWTQAVLKIQVHAGGRGKAGGVKIAKSLDEMLSLSKQLIGMKMVNRQTGKDGVIAHKIMLSPLSDIEKEYYLSIVIDREKACACVVASLEGGVNIEEVAEKTPEKIFKMPLYPKGEVKSFQVNKLCSFMGWKGEQGKQARGILQGLAKAFFDFDATLLEINPLILTKQGNLEILDTKMSVDDNAMFRQKEVQACYDPTQRAKNEQVAKESDLAYIALDGSIGCMVNGAGLAMSTMDIIQYYGSSPANFLDVGGGASKEKVKAGFEIILRDPKVRGILVNIFGGIMDCAILAEGLIAAAEELNVTVPLVVRMEGTHAKEGREILSKSSIKIIPAASLGEAAEKVVAATKDTEKGKG